MAENIWYRIRKHLGMLSYEESRIESSEQVKNSIRAQMIHPDDVNWSDGIKTENIPKKDKLRPRSILEDWGVTQDSG